MRYKTIVLELLREHPSLARRLARGRLLLEAVDRYSTELKNGHEAWTERLGRARPGSHPAQIASEALELALQELEGRLSPESTEADSAGPSLEEAMAFVRAHTPPA